MVYCMLQHLGEHHLLFGKTEPYETDIRLPMYILGPGVPHGQIRYHPTNHLDITATIVELSGASSHVPADRPLDGLSFAAALTNSPPTIEVWREYSFSEFYVNDNTWWAIRHINTSGIADWTMHMWCSNQTEVFRLADDPWQLRNLAGDSAATDSFGRDTEEKWLPIMVSMSKCSGTKECSAPVPAIEWNRSWPLPCHDAGAVVQSEEYWLDP